MKTVVLGDPPPVLASLIAERKRLGLDTHDEVWQGEYHMAPAASFEHGRVGAVLASLLATHAPAGNLTVGLEFNLGELNDFRVPDLGLHRGSPSGVWLPTAAIVVEVRSPNDESLEKFDFYFGHGVDEVLIVDLTTHAVAWFLRAVGGFVEAPRSALLQLPATEIAFQLNW